MAMEDDDGRLAPRQIWAAPTSTTTRSYVPGCTPFLLPSDGMFLAVAFALPLLYWPEATGLGVVSG